jgi:hypothetical protein
MRKSSPDLKSVSPEIEERTMASQSPGTLTGLLEDIHRGEAGAADQLAQLLGAEQHQLARVAMRRERAGHTLSTTDLAHEASLRLMEDDVWDRAEKGLTCSGPSRGPCGRSGWSPLTSPASRRKGVVIGKGLDRSHGAHPGRGRRGPRGRPADQVTRPGKTVASATR